MPAFLPALAAPVIAGAKALGNMALGGVARQVAQTGLGAAAKEGAKAATEGGLKEGAKAAAQNVNREKLMDFAQQAGQQHARKKQMEDQKRDRHLESTRQAAERSRGGTTSGFGQ